MSPRRAALDILERCRKEGAWSAAALDGAVDRYGLDQRDAALASRLCLGVLQNSLYCDHYIELFSARHADTIQPQLLNILRLGLYQLFFMDRIPARAAVNECVSLCREIGMERASGLVNAVLRRASENRDRLPPVPGEGAEYLSIRYSHPLWLVKRLLSEQDYSFTEAFLAANNKEPGLTIQVNTNRISPEDFKRALQRAEISFEEWPELPGCLQLEGGSVTALPGYEDGLFYVQDCAARIAVEAAAPEPGMRVLDVCAAPGGKSFACALRMKDRGSIISCDIHEKKLDRIRSGAQRLGLQCITARAGDARIPVDEWTGAFDLVIADVPCSGFGVIRKHPEIRYKTENEINRLPAIQRDILQTASEYVRPGGSLLYSTCTVLNAENRDNILAFLEQNPQFECQVFSVGQLKADGGMYAFWPQRDGTDGFFAAKLRRKE